MTDAIRQFPRKKARTLRFSCGAPRSARAIADGSRVLFLRSDGPEDTVTSLWMSAIDENGHASETLLADPRTLLADADAEDVPAEERARRERAREGGSGIVGYSTDASGNRVTFTINGQLFLTDISAGVTRTIEIDEDELKPVLNPRISPDGHHVMYTTGTYLVDVDLADDEEIGDAISVVASIPQNGEWKIGLAEFAAGEEMDRYDGFWWSPDSKYVLFETYDESPEPIWHLSDPANPTNPAQANRYPQALTANADVHLTLLELGFDSDNCCYGAIANEVVWDRESYEYLAVVSWTDGHEPVILVQDRLQQHDQVLAIHVGEPIATMRDAENGFTDDNGDEVETFSIAIPEYAEGERPGSTRVLEEHSNDYWIDLIHGTPAFTPNGRLICAMNDMDANTNRLTVDGVPFTPAGLQVREVLDVTDDDVLCVVQRTPELLPDDSLPFLWQSNAAEHDARSFDVVSIRYDGTWEPLTYTPGQWTMSRAGNGCVVTGRGMDDATVQMQHCMNVATTDGNGTDMTSMVVSPIENHAETPGFTPNVHFTRLGERGLYTAIVMPSAGSEYAHATTLPVLIEALRRSRIPASRRKPILLLGCAMVGRPRLHRGHRRRTRHHRTRAEMGPCHLRNHEIRDARRPSRRPTCAAGSVGNTGCARKQEILGNHHPATRPQSRCHDRLVVWRIPFRARRVGSAGNVRCGLRGCTSDRLDAVRHALHRALPRPRPGRVQT